MAVRRELVIDECGGASRRRRQAHAFNFNQLNQPIGCQTSEKLQQRGGENGLCADPLAKDRFLPPPAVFVLLSILCFASVFPFFGRLSVARFLAQVNGRKIAA